MFQNREEAGKLLAEKLKEYQNSNPLILAIPRGGVVVGAEIAKRLKIPLSVVVVKKLGAPGNPELAIGAVTSKSIYIDYELAARVGADEEYIKREREEKRKEIVEREKRFKMLQWDNVPMLQRNVILVDDGIATGATTLAAIKYIKGKGFTLKAHFRTSLQCEHPEGERVKGKVILAVPVIARDTYNQLKAEVEEIVALEIPEYLAAVGQFYQDFRQISDKEVIDILNSK